MARTCVSPSTYLEQLRRLHVLVDVHGDQVDFAAAHELRVVHETVQDRAQHLARLAPVRKKVDEHRLATLFARLEELRKALRRDVLFDVARRSRGRETHTRTLHGCRARETDCVADKHYGSGPSVVGRGRALGIMPQHLLLP